MSYKMYIMCVLSYIQYVNYYLGRSNLLFIQIVDYLLQIVDYLLLPFLILNNVATVTYVLHCTYVVPIKSIFKCTGYVY